MRPEHEVAVPVVGNLDPVTRTVNRPPLRGCAGQRREFGVFEDVVAGREIRDQPPPHRRSFDGGSGLLLSLRLRHLLLRSLLLRDLWFGFRLSLRLRLLLRRCLLHHLLLRGLSGRRLRFWLRLSLRLRLRRGQRFFFRAAADQQRGGRSEGGLRRASQQVAASQSQAG